MKVSECMILVVLDMHILIVSGLFVATTSYQQLPRISMTIAVFLVYLPILPVLVYFKGLVESYMS